MWSQTQDGSIIDQATGKVVFFSFARFKQDLILSNSFCFICGRKKSSSVKFNEEHVIPDWLLTHFDLKVSSLSVTLPNEFKQKYGTYKLPCCVECNAGLGNFFEVPISEAVKLGDISLESFLRSRRSVFCAWIALIYVKLHLKDKNFFLKLDQRVESPHLYELYDLNNIYLAHCIVKAVYGGHSFNRSLFGSLVTLKMIDMSEDVVAKSFDLLSNSLYCTIMLRLNNTAFCLVFNDCGACAQLFLNGKYGAAAAANKLSFVQSREMCAELCWINSILTTQPSLTLIFNLRNKYLLVDQQRLAPVSVYQIQDKSIRSDIMQHALKGLQQHLVYEENGALIQDENKVLARILNNTLTFVFDEKGRFMSADRQQN